MKTQTKYPHIPKPGRSAGYVEIMIPIAFLVDQFAIRSLLEALKLVQRGKSIDDTGEFLSTHGVGPETLGLSGFASGARPNPIKWQGSLASLQRLDRSIDDLIQENGEWREQIEGIMDEARDFEIAVARQDSF